MLSVKELCQEANISQPTFYRLIKENESFRELIESNRAKRGNGYRYDTAVLDWLIAYYGIERQTETGVGQGLKREQVETNPEQAPHSPQDAFSVDELDSVRAENAALKEALETLKRDLEREREEKRLLLEQNGLALLALKEEQAEKQKYLPSSRKTLGQFFKGFFLK